jgi:hypothetical protein
MKQNSNMTLVALLLLTKLSLGGTFTQSIKGYPKTTPNCYLLAQEVAKQFETGTHSTVSHIECSKETGFDFEVEYQAVEKLNFTSTDYNSSGAYERGRYAELKACNKNLSSQVSIFEQATQVKSIFSYCRNDGFSFKPWEVIIIGAGEPKLEPRMDGYLFFTTPKNITYSQLFNGLKVTLRHRISGKCGHGKIGRPLLLK